MLKTSKKETFNSKILLPSYYQPNYQLLPKFTVQSLND